MAVLTDQQIADMVTTTLHKYGRGRWNQIAQELTEYYVMPRLLRTGNVRVISDGIGIKEHLMNKTGGESRWVGLKEEDVLNQVDVLDEITVLWCRLTDNMSWERRQLLENRGESRLNNVILPQRVAMMLRMATALEASFWGSPDPNDIKKPWGLKYWVVKNATQGFNGGIPSGFSNVGGVSLTDTPTFKNWTDTYVSITKADLIKKLRKAHRRTNWRSPTKAAGMLGDFGMRRALWMNEVTISEFEDVGEGQNENLGRDVASMDDMIVFKKHPINYVPYLNDDSTNPVYMLEDTTITPFVLKGDNLRESDAKISPRQHNSIESHVDLSVNFVMTNRRANAVINL